MEGCKRGLCDQMVASPARLLIRSSRNKQIAQQVQWFGGMAERFKAPVLKTGVGASSPWVRIPLPPPDPAAAVLEPANRLRNASALLIDIMKLPAAFGAFHHGSEPFGRKCPGRRGIAGATILNQRVFQQVVSLGPNCRAKQHMKQNFGDRITRRGVFDWQVTPGGALLEYLRRDFHGMFERADLAVIAGKVTNLRYGTEHPHEFPIEVTEAQLDLLFPAARKAHDGWCRVSQDMIADSLTTLFILGLPVPNEVADEFRAHVQRVNPRKRFELLLSPVGDVAEWRGDAWKGDAELWVRHLSQFQICPPLSARLRHQLRRLHKNFRYFLPRSQSRLLGGTGMYN
jgi:hypothetical protein